MLHIGESVIIKIVYDNFNASFVENSQSYILVEQQRQGYHEEIENQLNRIRSNSNIINPSVINFDTINSITFGYDVTNFTYGTSFRILDSSYGLYVPLEKLKRIECLYYFIYKKFKHHKYNPNFNPSEKAKKEIDYFLKEHWK